jgi:peptidoglycan/xylan/chitin deacetylase (PgdA/CDA1 family)
VGRSASARTPARRRVRRGALVMFGRAVAAALASALALLPATLSSPRASDRGGFPLRSASLARAADTAADADAHAPVNALSRVAAFGFGARTPFSPSTAPRELVLTFDDGPDLKHTPVVLDELDRHGVKAIFFVTGDRLVGNRPEDLARRELVRQIAARGHLVANHTMTHRNLCQHPDEAAAEIDSTSEVLAASTGVRPMLFRAPYGARCRVLEAALAARELGSVGWNLDPQDWNDQDSAGVLSYLTSRLHRLRGRGILLLHDTHPASVFAVGPMLDWIARENRRAAAAGQPPIVLRDYRVFLPDHPLPSTGLGALLAGIARQLPLPAGI